jgi:hypothetical protein
MVNAQRGQATAEALVVLGLIALLGTAVAAVGSLQWQGLEASHGTRLQAFRYALGDRKAGTAVSSKRPSPRAAGLSGPGGPRFAALRRELGVEDGGMVEMHAAHAVPLHRHHGGQVVVRRHSAILAGAGHAAGDEQTQRRIMSSDAAWGRAARHSLAVAQRTRSRLKDIDRGWARPAPDLDWLSHWADLVPADRRSGRGGRGRRFP